ncbi:hypothetical protein RUND412_001916 [Rhizina undulata]
MPYVPNTPEAHIAFLSPRDHNICRGVANSGQPCSRILTPSKNGEPTSGIIAVVNGQEAYYCNKHQEQAKDVVLRHTASFARRRENIGRGSMDTLIEKVELLVAGGEDGDGTIATTVVSTTRKVKREDDPFVKGLAGRFRAAEEVDEESDSDATVVPQNLPSPPTPPTNFKVDTKHSTKPQAQQQSSYDPKKKEKKKQGFLQRLICCCFSSLTDDDSDDEGHQQAAKEAELRAAAAAVVEDDGGRPRKENKKDAKVAFETTPPTPPLPMLYPDRKPVPGALVKDSPAKGAKLIGKGMSPATPARDDDIRAVIPADKVTQYAFSLIPQHLSPKTALRLQQELAKPFSPKDEAGYIYVFWLTDSPISPLSTPGASTPGPKSSQRNTDALLKKAVQAESSSTPQRILLKIGRANNVQRRLHEWSTQCGYNLSLIRYYPHVSSSISSSPEARNKQWLNSQVGRKVPNSHRVEHLIHLELRDVDGSNFIHSCDACGKVHKEWFSIEASRAGLRGVDEVINRWIEYAERTSSGEGAGAAAAQGVSSPPPPKERKRGDATPVRTDDESGPSKDRKKREVTPNAPVTPKKTASPSDKQQKNTPNTATSQSSNGRLKVKMPESDSESQTPSKARTPRKQKLPSPGTGASPSAGRGRKKGDAPPRTGRKKESDATYKYDENDDPDWSPDDEE